MYVGIHIMSHFRQILDKTQICQQRAVKIIKLQQFQESRWCSTCSMQKNSQVDGHYKTNSRIAQLLAKTPKNETLNQNTEN
jgi:hypothetical protein